MNTHGVDAFLDHLDMRGHSPATVRTYRAVYARFPGMDGATVDDAEAWWVTRRGLSPSTRRLELAAVRAFYKWQQRYDVRPDDPTRRIDPPKLPNRLPKPITEKQYAHLLETLTGAVLRAVVLGCEAGLRVSECATASWEDLTVSGNTAGIRVTGKGSKTRIAGSRPEIVDLLGGPGEGNIVTAGGPPMEAHALGERVRRQMHAAGVKASHHSCRHRYATALLDGGAEPLAVQRSMGHASPATTAGYIALSPSHSVGIAKALSSMSGTRQ